MMYHAGSGRLKTACGLVVAIVGLSALAGWGMGQRSAVGDPFRLHPDGPEYGGRLLAAGDRARCDARRRRPLVAESVAVVGTAGFVAGLVGFRLAEYVLSIDLGVHGWFFRGPDRTARAGARGQDGLVHGP